MAGANFKGATLPDGSIQDQVVSISGSAIDIFSFSLKLVTLENQNKTAIDQSADFEKSKQSSQGFQFLALKIILVKNILYFWIHHSTQSMMYNNILLHLIYTVKSLSTNTLIYCFCITCIKVSSFNCFQLVIVIKNIISTSNMFFFHEMQHIKNPF